MKRSDIPLEDFLVRPVDLWHRQSLLLAAGDFSRGDYNVMTVGWGGFGVMWAKPLAVIFVRPTRYTMSFTDRFDSFTLCAFPETYREALDYCGSHSGRDGDKVKASGLTAIRSREVAAPGFEEAELILECRKTYVDDLDPARFLDPATESHYPRKDYHRMYFGEIVAASGTPAWRRSS
jgi:flavin reductase (DIM6/NTAB) family NADH-FMN oxidoreductase RutF